MEEKKQKKYRKYKFNKLMPGFESEAMIINRVSWNQFEKRINGMVCQYSEEFILSNPDWFEPVEEEDVELLKRFVIDALVKSKDSSIENLCDQLLALEGFPIDKLRANYD